MDDEKALWKKCAEFHGHELSLIHILSVCRKNF